MQKRIIYFDCNATTPLIKEAADAAISALTERFANPSSVHWEGCLAQRIRETARARASQLLGTKNDEIIFTSGATESIHTAVFSAINHAKELQKLGKQGTRNLVLCGATEHKVVPEALRHWIAILGADLKVLTIPVNKNGQFQEDFLQEHMQKCFFICTMAVNNETGAVQDLSLIESLIHHEMEKSSKPLWLVDGVQALGKIEIHLDRGLIDYCAFSGHKVYAPKGTGILFARLEAPYFPLFVGGGQEAGRRSGTEALPALSGLSQVLQFFLEIKENPVFSEKNPFRQQEELKEFRSQLIASLTAALPGFELNLPETHTVPSTVHFSVKGFSYSEIWVLLEAHGVLVSSGSACQSSQVAPSHVMLALNAEPWKLASATRLSFGLATLASEIEEGCKRIQSAGISLAQTYSKTRNIVRISNGQFTALAFIDPMGGRNFTIGSCTDLDDRIMTVLDNSEKALKTPQRNHFKSNYDAFIGRTFFAYAAEKQEKIAKYGDWNLQFFFAKETSNSENNIVTILVHNKKAEQLKFIFFSDSLALQNQTKILQETPLGLGIICTNDTDGSGFPFCIREGKSYFVHEVNPKYSDGVEISLSDFDSINKDHKLVDVRENYERSDFSPFQFAALTLSGKYGEAFIVPVSEICAFALQESLEDPKRTRKSLYFCRSGKRAHQVATLMKLLGWQDSRSLEGGLSCLASSLEKSHP